MKRHIAPCGLAVIGIYMGMTIGLAQSGPQAAGQDGRDDDHGGPVTVTGCLIEFSNNSSASGSTAASDSSGAATASSSSQSSLTSVREQFVLANARPASSSSRRPGTNTDTSVPGGAGASGTAGSGATPQSASGGATTPATAVAPPSPSGDGASNAATRYLVTGLQTDELRKHVMHQVEVSGTLDPRNSTPASTSSPGTADDMSLRGETSRSRVLTDLRRLDASSIRMIAQACTPPGSQE